MRRNDREITDKSKQYEIIQACDCCRIGFKEKDGVYILPMNFAFTEEDAHSVFYFHGAGEGKKAEFAKTEPVVGFELDTNHKIQIGSTACGYSFQYQSIIGKGIFQTVFDKEEKKKALELIMRHYSKKSVWQFDEKMTDSVSVFKLTVLEMTCKEHLQ